LLRPRRDLSVFRRSRVERGCRLRPKNPCERGGRLYAADRGDKIWTEADVARLLAAASREMELALILALWTGQRQGDLLTLPWSAYDGSHLRGAVVATAARIRRADALARHAPRHPVSVMGGRPSAVFGGTASMVGFARSTTVNLIHVWRYQASPVCQGNIQT
jgi:integrase